MEFLVGFELKVLEGASESEVEQRISAEAAASAELARKPSRAALEAAGRTGGEESHRSVPRRERS